MIRAVSALAALMSRPYHCTRELGSIRMMISTNRFLDWWNQVLISGPERLRYRRATSSVKASTSASA